jgi:hypothetical protein
MSKPPGLEFDTPYTLDEIKEKWDEAEKVTKETEKYDTNKDGILDDSELLNKKIHEQVIEELKKHQPGWFSK